MGCHLPLPIVFDINLQRADAKTILAHHLDVNESGQCRRLGTVEPDLQVAECETLVPWRPRGDSRDVLRLGLQLPAGVSVLKIVGHKALQSGGVLFDGALHPAVRRLMDQQIDPMKVNINWEEFREKQREAASEAVRGALALDEVARREHIAATEEDISAEVERYAERSGRSSAAVRAKLEKEGGIARLYSGLRREKTVDFLLSKATKVQAG